MRGIEEFGSLFAVGVDETEDVVCVTGEMVLADFAERFDVGPFRCRGATEANVMKGTLAAEATIDESFAEGCGSSNDIDSILSFAREEMRHQIILSRFNFAGFVHFHAHRTTASFMAGQSLSVRRPSFFCLKSEPVRKVNEENFTVTETA